MAHCAPNQIALKFVDDMAKYLKSGSLGESLSGLEGTHLVGAPLRVFCSAVLAWLRGGERLAKLPPLSLKRMGSGADVSRFLANDGGMFGLIFIVDQDAILLRDETSAMRLGACAAARYQPLRHVTKDSLEGRNFGTDSELT